MSEPERIVEWGWTDSIDEAMGLGPSAWIDYRDLLGPDPVLDDDDEPITDLGAYARGRADKVGGRAYTREVTRWVPVDGADGGN